MQCSGIENNKDIVHVPFCLSVRQSQTHHLYVSDVEQPLVHIADLR